jgi:hypothetical protein
VSVVRFDVAHAARVGDSATEQGLLGLKSFSVRLGDVAKVAVLLSRPAHGYLIAYAADGGEHLLYPAADRPPALMEKLRYPAARERGEYVFDDGVGLHVFVAILGNEPLPAYAEWVKMHGRAPWSKAPGRVGAVWRQVGGDLHAATAADPDVRGPGAVELGVAPVEKLAGWWRKQPGIAAVGLTGFAVTKAE